MQRELILVEAYEEFCFSIRETLLLQTSNKADPTPRAQEKIPLAFFVRVHVYVLVYKQLRLL